MFAGLNVKEAIIYLRITVVTRFLKRAILINWAWSQAAKHTLGHSSVLDQDHYRLLQLLVNIVGTLSSEVSKVVFIEKQGSIH